MFELWVCGGGGLPETPQIGRHVCAQNPDFFSGRVFEKYLVAKKKAQSSQGWVCTGCGAGFVAKHPCSWAFCVLGVQKMARKSSGESFEG